MPRNAAAYLADIVDSCDAISEVLEGLDLAAYCAMRPVRSAVEREFTIIGEAITALGRLQPSLVDGISHSRLIVGFRNRLVHEYPQVDDEAVYSIARRDVPILRVECAGILARVDLFE